MFYLITYIAEFLYVRNNTNKELRNGKSKQNIRGVTPGQTSPFFPVKYDQKDLYFTPSLIWPDF